MSLSLLSTHFSRTAASRSLNLSHNSVPTLILVSLRTSFGIVLIRYSSVPTHISVLSMYGPHFIENGTHAIFFGCTVGRTRLIVSRIFCIFIAGLILIEGWLFQKMSFWRLVRRLIHSFRHLFRSFICRSPLWR